MNAIFSLTARWIHQSLFFAVAVIPAVVTATDFSKELATKPVELPGFIVKADSPWRYAQCGPFEVLSRCRDDETTAKWFSEFVREVRVMRCLFPEGFLPEEMPALAIVHEDSQIAKTTENWAGAVLSDGSDYDLPVYFINIEWFGRKSVEISEDRGYMLRSTVKYMKWLLDCRKPRPPGWLAVGLEKILEPRVFCKDSVRTWMWTIKWKGQRFENNMIIEVEIDVQRMLEMWDALPPTASDIPKELKDQAALFIVWALRDTQYTPGFWKFVERSSKEKLTESLFQECFGLNYAQATLRARKQLVKWIIAERNAADNSKYVLASVRSPVQVPEFEVRSARSTEIGRIVGEWRRLVSALETTPESRNAALEATRLSMLRNVQPPRADAAFLAALGLCEKDAGRDDEALEHLGAAVRAGVQRPRACLDYARLMYDRELRGLSGADAKFSPEQTRTLLESLLAARKQAPALPGVYALMTDIWSRSSEKPSVADLAIVQEGTRLFIRETPFVLSAIRLHHALGFDAEAAEIANRWLKTPDGRSREEQLKTLIR